MFFSKCSKHNKLSSVTASNRLVFVASHFLFIYGCIVSTHIQDDIKNINTLIFISKKSANSQYGAKVKGQQ